MQNQQLARRQETGFLGKCNGVFLLGFVLLEPAAVALRRGNENEYQILVKASLKKWSDCSPALPPVGCLLLVQPDNPNR
jgi:hypothetical protein